MNSQIRAEIIQIILGLPEHQLKPILEYLQQIEKTTEEQSDTATLIKNIFQEDKELLKKLV